MDKLLEEIINRHSAYIQEGNDILTELSNAVYEAWNTRNIPSVEDIINIMWVYKENTINWNFDWELNGLAQSIHKLIKGE
jgi:hypothetical protein